MTKDYEALREAVADAIEEVIRRGPIDCADAALTVIREALREPCEAMLEAVQGTCPASVAAHEWRAMFAASPLGGPRDE